MEIVAGINITPMVIKKGVNLSELRDGIRWKLSTIKNILIDCDTDLIVTKIYSDSIIDISVPKSNAIACCKCLVKGLGSDFIISLDKNRISIEHLEFKNGHNK